MSKKLFFLISFVLVVGLIGTARAGPIDVNNPSFEYDINGVQITEQLWCGQIGGWSYRNESDWGAADAWMYATVGDGYTGFETVDGTVAFASATIDVEPNDIVQIYQVLADANAIIAEERRYTLTFNAINPHADTNHDVNSGFFYSTGLDVNGEANSVNDVTLASSRTPLLFTAGDYSSWDEVTLTYLAMPGAGSIGERLAVRLSVSGHPEWPSGLTVLIDNVQVKWDSAGNAWNPSPADGAEDVVRDVNLTWSPGEWADEHIVYFSDDVNKVSTRHQDANQGRQGATLFDPTPGGGLLVPGRAYHWTITEVNDPNTWLGDIWSFTAGGKAKNVYPADKAGDIPALDLLLRWEAGTGSDGHDVYFGSDEAAVEDANTNTTGIYRGPTQALSDVNYPVPEDLDVGEPYFWRIDEVNAVTVKGDVWEFTTGVFLIVDSFEFYTDDTHIKNIWKDRWAGIITKNMSEVFVETANVDKFLDTGKQSMKYYYRNFEMSGGSPVGCTAEATLPLEVGTNWTRGGVKALVVNFCGDTGNGQEPDAKYTIANDRMWMSLLDGGSKEGILIYPDMNHVTDGSWHEWNISLEDPNFSGVNMANVAKVYIGFGGAKGQAVSKYGAGYTSGGDTVWFDDIRLYPPRCVPTEVDLPSLGDITEDCNTDYFDLDIMTTDWLVSDAEPPSVPPAAPPEVWYRFDEGTGSTDVYNHGSWSGYDVTVPVSDAPSWTSDVAPVLDPCNPDYAMDFDADDYLEVPNDAPSQFAGTQNMSITAWVKPEAEMAQWDYPSIVESRVGRGGENMHASGFGFGEYNKLIYWWNDDYWDWDAGGTHPYPDYDVWSFVAVTIEPTQATLYLSDGSSLGAWTNVAAHGVLVDWDSTYTNYICVNSNSADPGAYNTFQGKIDDLRLYNKTLTLGEIMGIADVSVYMPNTSIANIFPKLPPPTSYNPNDPDIVNFKDYRVLAEHWLEQHPWP